MKKLKNLLKAETQLSKKAQTTQTLKKRAQMLKKVIEIIKTLKARE